VDVDCYTRVPGRPFMPMEIHQVILEEHAKLNPKAPGAEARPGQSKLV